MSLYKMPGIGHKGPKIGRFYAKKSLSAKTKLRLPHPHMNKGLGKLRIK